MPVENLTLNEYQAYAMTTRLPTADLGYVTLGLVGEIGELYGKIAKSLRDDTTVPQDDIKKELGDILWFIAAMCYDHKLSLEDVAKTNIEKLQSRKQRNTLKGSGDNR